ncbi:progonadoliberin-2 isoform X2 [Brachyhypopomus gauderio]|uniref:progonadoliberin-2 isoform X2 n=1 Tax=Brachyhypopomus gauderio TaxID=698409 RepID=UPI004041CF74
MIKVMVFVGKILLLSALLLCCGVQLSVSQHWSHGWYPGGKREISSYSSPEVSGEIRLCEAGECSYLRPPRSSVLRTFLLDAMAREFQKRK